MATGDKILAIPGPSGLLKGVLVLPPGARDCVVIVPGSGPTDCDGNGPPGGLSSDCYRLLAAGLARHGIASVRIDKRGLFGSAGAVADGNDVTLAGYAADLCGWVTRAAQLVSRVWVAGHSEGGLVALRAAGMGAVTPRGLILLATPGRTIDRIVMEQIGRDPAYAALQPRLLSVFAALRAGLPPAEQAGPLQALFSTALHGYWRDMLAQDPVALAQKWRGPALILQGGADVQVTMTDAALLASALPQARIPALPGMTHMLKSDVPGDPLVTYRDPTLPLHPGLLPAITTFIASI